MPQKDLFSWNTMIWGYVNGFQFTKAHLLFQNMRIEGVKIDKVSLSCLLSTCTSHIDLRTGEMLHAYARVVSLECEDSIGTALINMYAKCREVHSARKLFNELPKQNIALWNAMVHGYAENGQASDVLMLLDQVKLRDLALDDVTVLGLIKACRDIKELRRCTVVHSLVESNDIFKRSLILRNALIDLYAKCGCMEKATSIFNTMPEKDVISWTSMIIGYAINSQGCLSLAMFQKMCENKIIPNAVTFIGVLFACDHTGMVDAGRNAYNMMQVTYGIKPQIEHCGCMVDMLARLGMLTEAKKFVHEMPMEPNAIIWRMLMYACRAHGHIKHGFNLLKSMPELNASHNYENFLLSSNLYAETGRWVEVVASRNLLDYLKARKGAATSLVMLTE